MTERNNIRRALRRLYRRDARDTQHVTLFRSTGENKA
jgi:hypothetical protein